MKARWGGVALVAISALGIVVYKERVVRTATGETTRPGLSAKPEIVLVADFREAGTNDNCAEIIRLVRAAASAARQSKSFPRTVILRFSSDTRS